MQVSYKSFEGTNPEAAYKESFGSTPLYQDANKGFSHEYYNPFRRLDKRSQIVETMHKASIDTQTGGAGTAGTALIPVFVDPNPVDRTEKETPLLDMLPRKAVRGLTYDYIPLTAKASATWELENDNIADQVDTYDRASVGMKFLYGKGRVSGPAIAATNGFIDVQALDVNTKSASMMEALEDAIINGDASTNPVEPNGLIVSITTNTTNMSSTLPTLAEIRAEYATSYNNSGKVRLAVTDKATHNYIKGLLYDVQRQVTNPSEAVLGFGIPDAFEFDGVMFITDRFMPTTTNAKRILFIDPRYVFLAVLQDLTFEVKYNEHDNYPFLMKWYGALVVTHEASCTQMYGIA